MEFINALRRCVTCQAGDDEAPSRNNGTFYLTTEGKSPTPKPTDDELIKSIIHTLFTAEKGGKSLEDRLDQIVEINGWYESLAQRLVNALASALSNGKEMSGMMKEAYDKASVETHSFIEEHPVLVEVAVTIVVFGILALLMPWAIEALGFGRLGPVAGMHTVFCSMRGLSAN